MAAKHSYPPTRATRSAPAPRPLSPLGESEAAAAHPGADPETRRKAKKQNQVRSCVILSVVWTVDHPSVGGFEVRAYSIRFSRL